MAARGTGAGRVQPASSKPNIKMEILRMNPR
jgi:hypothetical protein